MILKRMAVISQMSNITDLYLSIHKTTSRIKILIKPVSAAKDMLPGSFQYYQLHLETLVVPKQSYRLIWGYAITYETN